MSQPKYTVEEYSGRIREFLDEVLDAAGLRLEPQVESGSNLDAELEPPDIMVRFSGADLELLLENKAELLLALEHLTQEALRIPPEGHARLFFDANDYRLLRMQELRLSAQTAAERVKQTGQPFFFSPMTSRERRIIHLALRNEKELRSESAGTGPFRQVCVLPLDAPLPPPPPPPPRPAFGREGSREGSRDRGPERREGGGRPSRGPRDRGPRRPY